MSRFSLLGGLFCLSAIVAGCNSNAEIANDSDSPPIPTAGPVDVPSDDGDTFLVKFETTKGDFVIRVHESWSPNGAERFRELVESGFYDGTRFFRVVTGFMVQFGINGDPQVQSKWRDANIPDDPVVEANERGYVTFAKSGAPNSRSTQVFINYGDNAFLNSQGFSPFGVVVEGMDVVDSINAEYGETPDQSRIQFEGNAYLEEAFPRLDFINEATIVEDGAQGATS